MLKHLPVANLNQVKDTKVLKVISKWAKKPSVSCGPEEETSSSDVDSRGLSPQDALDDASRRETHLISSSSDELQNSSKSVETQKSAEIDCPESAAECSTAEQNEKTAEQDEKTAEQNEKTAEQNEKTAQSVEDNVFEPGEIRSDEELKPEGDKPEGIKSEGLNSEGQNPEEPKSEEVKMEDEKSEGSKSESVKPHRLKGTKHRYSRIVERLGESSEEESPRWSEDDATSSDSESIIDLAANLLDQWSSLKVVM